ncbi:MAG: hypothetical protein ABI537_06750 [Casimicrobiaceae bacterium]
MKLVTCLLFATMLAGCLPVGIRATNLPNYAGLPQSLDNRAPVYSTTA